MHIPLVMFPNGFLVRTMDIPEGGVIVDEPDEEYINTSVVDQTAAVTGRSDFYVTGTAKAKYDV